MEVQETLNTLAEIFVAVAGFTAVMIVLRSDTTSESTSLVRMVATVGNCFASAACALLSVSLLVISIGLWMEANATILILALIWYLVLQGYGFIANLAWAASRE